MKKNGFIEYSPDVKKALDKGKPVVALETAMITHGQSYPQNFEAANRLADTVRSEGATPAFTAVINGSLRAGLSDQDLDYLCRAGADLKIAGRRDIALMAASGEDCSAAASAAMLTAGLAGIRAVAVGGIGGVHRGGENNMDISSDLDELARSRVIVISSGPKTLLDVGLTLEHLETLGVPVIGFGTDEVPALYTRTSGFKADCVMQTAAELARAFRVQEGLGIPGGMLVANPVPQQYALDASVLGRAIDIAAGKAAELGVRGRQLTPFLLALIKEMTGGKSLEAETVAALGNARLAAQTAVVLSAITDDDDGSGLENSARGSDMGLGENLAREMQKTREQLHMEFSEMMSAYMSGGAAARPSQPEPSVQPAKPVQPAPLSPAAEKQDPPVSVGSGTPVLDDRPFIAFVPGQNNDRHGPVKPQAEHTPEPDSENGISAEYRADAFGGDEPGDRAEAEEPAETEKFSDSVYAAEPEPEPAEEEEFTVYDPDKYRAKHEAERAARAADHHEDSSMEPAPGSTTEYDPETYRKRALERKRRMAIASGEPIPEDAKTDEDRQAEAAALVDCKGPLEFTGEHPLAWKCTRCGQLFEKHEIPHKRPKLPDE